MMPLSEAIAIRAQQLQGADVDRSAVDEAIAVIQKSETLEKQRDAKKRTRGRKYRPEDTVIAKRLRVVLWRMGA